DQARRVHASQPALAARPARGRGLPGDAAVSATLSGAAPASPAEVERQLERTWRPVPGLLGWLRSVDHKSIGLRYVVTAFVFFLLGGVEAAVLAVQIARTHAQRFR